MLSLIARLFGTYTPVTYTVYQVVGEEVEAVEVVARGAAGLDWPWIAGVVLFSICLWSFFRLVGVLLRG